MSIDVLMQNSPNSNSDTLLLICYYKKENKVCNKKFLSNKSLKRHITELHNHKSSTGVCGIMRNVNGISQPCAYTSQRPSNFIRHQKSFHHKWYHRLILICKFYMCTSSTYNKKEDRWVKGSHTAYEHSSHINKYNVRINWVVYLGFFNANYTMNLHMLHHLLQFSMNYI